MSISRSQTGRKRIFLPSKLFLLIEAVLEKAEIDYFFIFSSILSLSASAYISSQLLSNFFPFSRPFSIFHLLWNSGERCEADGRRRCFCMRSKQAKSSLYFIFK